MARKLEGEITSPELMKAYLDSQEDIFKFIPGGVNFSNGWQHIDQLDKASNARGGATRLMAICHELEEMPSNIVGRFFAMGCVTIWSTAVGGIYEQVYLLQACYWIRNLFNRANIYSTDYPAVFDKEERGTKTMADVRYMGRTHVPQRYSGFPYEIYNLSFVFAQSGVKTAREMGALVRA